MSRNKTYYTNSGVAIETLFEGDSESQANSLIRFMVFASSEHLKIYRRFNFIQSHSVSTWITIAGIVIGPMIAFGQVFPALILAVVGGIAGYATAMAIEDISIRKFRSVKGRCFDVTVNGFIDVSNLKNGGAYASVVLTGTDDHDLFSALAKRLDGVVRLIQSSRAISREVLEEEIAEASLIVGMIKNHDTSDSVKNEFYNRGAQAIERMDFLVQNYSH